MLFGPKDQQMYVAFWPNFKANANDWLMQNKCKPPFYLFSAISCGNPLTEDMSTYIKTPQLPAILPALSCCSKKRMQIGLIAATLYTLHYKREKERLGSMYEAAAI